MREGCIGHQHNRLVCMWTMPGHCNNICIHLINIHLRHKYEIVSFKSVLYTNRRRKVSSYWQYIYIYVFNRMYSCDLTYPTDAEAFYIYTSTVSKPVNFTI
jgi:hypothetical protein